MYAVQHIYSRGICIRKGGYTTKRHPKKHPKRKINFVWTFAALSLFFVVLFGVSAIVLRAQREKISCNPVPDQPPEQGSQGFHIWSGPTLLSFKHDGKPVCVPDGWQALGESASGPGWALFPDDRTGLLIQKRAFASERFLYRNTSFEVRVVYPVNIRAEHLLAYMKLIENAFVSVGSLYPSLKDAETRPHTVLITAGLAGDTYGSNSRVYPDPGPDLTHVVRTPEQWRSQELVIHAVAHLYNRYRRSWMNGYKPDPSLPDEDWQELEATWAETAFSTSDDGRIDRLRYLYNVHTAVQTDNFSLITAAPFDNKDEFEKIHRDVVMKPDASYIDDQYGHYILAPLAMVATQGLLMQLTEQKIIPATDIVEILKQVHAGKYENYFNALSKVLPSDAVAQITGWMHGGETIPENLVLKGAEQYRLK